MAAVGAVGEVGEGGALAEGGGAVGDLTQEELQKVIVAIGLEPGVKAALKRPERDDDDEEGVSVAADKANDTLAPVVAAAVVGLDLEKIRNLKSAAGK